ncbi:MAG: SCO family protein [Acidobacteria bacterium]|nr:SCO family protein [Acidobacteriota bacterium]
MQKHDSDSRCEGQRRYVFMLCLLLGLFYQACAKPEEKRYELQGKVVNVDKPGKVVTIAHEKIAGYMEAMTMPFRLQDEALLNEMQDGDKVTATLVVSDSRSWLEEVIVTQERVDESYKSAKKFEPNLGDEVPDFSLVNQSGRAIHLKQYHGRALLLTFIYTRCPLPDYCPLMTRNFAIINQALKNEAVLYDKTHLLSITVDPDYDKPAVLRDYALRHNQQQDFTHWEMATGSKDEVKKVAEYFGLIYQTAADQIVHNLQTALIAPDGKLVKLYRGNEWQPDEILDDIKKLNLK